MQHLGSDVALNKSKFIIIIIIRRQSRVYVVRGSVWRVTCNFITVNSTTGMPMADIGMIIA